MIGTGIRNRGDRITAIKRGLRPSAILLAIACASAGCDDDNINALKTAGTFEPQSINFGEVTIGTTAVKNVLLKNTGNTVLSIDSIEVPVPYAIADTKGMLSNILLPLGESMELTVRFMAMDAGAKPATIIARAGELEIKLEVLATGVVDELPELSLSPNSLEFGAVALGSSDLAQITISNSGRADGSIVKAVLDSSMSDSIAGDQYFATINYPHIVQAGASTTIDIVFAPQTAGSKPDKLTFVTSTGRQLELLLSGDGLIPQGNLVCSPSTVNLFRVKFPADKPTLAYPSRCRRLISTPAAPSSYRFPSPPPAHHDP
jgi:hypothetical protein